MIFKKIKKKIITSDAIDLTPMEGSKRLEASLVTKNKANS